jgi:3-oxoadipate enol-lactonase
VRLTIEAGVLPSGLSYRRCGSGPGLVICNGLTPDHEPPRGILRRLGDATLRHYGTRFTTWQVQRPVGVDRGTTHEDFADQLATALTRARIDPISLLGISSGGYTALAMAARHPGLVTRLAVVDATATLSGRGRQLQSDAAARMAAGKHRDAWRRLATAGTTTRSEALLIAAIATISGMLTPPRNPTDAQRVLEADLSFDGIGLAREIQAPTVVAVGAADPFNDPADAHRTATAIPHGQALVIPHAGHGIAREATVRRHLDQHFRPPA